MTIERASRDDERSSGNDTGAAADGAGDGAPDQQGVTQGPSIAQRLGPTGALGVLWMALPALGGFYLIARLGAASEWLDGRGPAGVAIYAAFFAIFAGVGLLPTYAQAALGGWVFAFTLGFPAAMIGFTLAALIGYAIARLVTRDKAEQVIAENARATAVRDALIGHGFWRTLGTITLVRIPPNSPFALTNLVMASAGVRLIPYSLGTLIGMAPRTGIVVAIAAAGAADGHRDIQSLVKDRGTLPLIIGIVVMIIVLAILGSIANRAINRVVAPGDS